MFTGSVPKPVVEQITRIVPFDSWGQVFVGCSGSFRVDRCLKARFPGVRVFGNDVSLLSVALGRLATGQPFPLAFTGALAFLEARGLTNFADRVAGVLYALELARFAGANEYARTHFAHYVVHADDYLAKARAAVTKFVPETPLDGFYAEDFRRMAKLALERLAQLDDDSQNSTTE